MRFDLIRLIALQRSQSDMFGRSPQEGGPLPPREAWFREIFGQPIPFQHYGSIFYFVPQTNSHFPPSLIIGRIGRVFHVTENLPPEEGLGEIDHEAWRAAAIIIDPTVHDDGQKAIVQDDRRVGAPASMLRSLASQINSRDPQEPFILETNPVVDPATFWAFEEENRDQITSISFELVPPNMFGIRTDLDQEMRDLREHEKARRAKLDLENPDGLKLDTARVRNTVGYALEGGGRIKARTKGRRRYDSRKKSKHVILPNPPEPESFVSKVTRAIAAIFTS